MSSDLTKSRIKVDLDGMHDKAREANLARREKYAEMSPEDLALTIVERARRQRIKQVTSDIVKGSKNEAHAKLLATQAKNYGRSLRAWMPPENFEQPVTMDEAVRSQRDKGRHLMVLESLYKIAFEGVLPVVVTTNHPVTDEPVTAIVDEPIHDVEIRLKAASEYANRIMGRPSASDKVEEQTSTQHLDRTKQAKQTLDDMTNEINAAARGNGGGTATAAAGDLSE